MAQQRSGSGCLIAAIVGGVVVALGVSVLAAVLVAFTLSSSGNADGWKPGLEEGGVDEFPQLERTWSYGSGDTTVVRIPIFGVITRSASSGMFGELSDPVGDVLACIQDATQDEEVMAIILEVDSPGGEVTASDVIYKALLDFKKAKKGRKVVALFGDVAASGAYYIAMAADYILVQPTTITGSIGVLISTMNFKELGDRFGVKDVTIKSGANKDLLNPLGEVTSAHLAIMQGVVDEIYGRFVSLVAEGRKLPLPEVRALADGRILTAKQAVDAKLVDGVGYWDDAVKKTAELVGVKTVKVFRYEQKESLWDLLRATSRSRLSVDGLKGLLEPKSPKLMYLWKP
jgi:protease-4